MNNMNGSASALDAASLSKRRLSSVPTGDAAAASYAEENPPAAAATRASSLLEESEETPSLSAADEARSPSFDLLAPVELGAARMPPPPAPAPLLPALEQALLDTAPANDEDAPPAEQVAACRGDRATSAELMDADIPTADAASVSPPTTASPKDATAAVAAGGKAGVGKKEVAARLSSASSTAVGDVQDRASASSVSVMETKVRYANRGKGKGKNKARRRHGKGGSAEVAASSNHPPNIVEGTVSPQPSSGNHRVSSDVLDEKIGAKAGGGRKGGSADSTAATTDATHRRSSDDSMDCKFEAGDVGVEVMASSSASVDFDNTKPGAVAVFPADATDSQRQDNITSYRSVESRNSPYDIVAEAHLVQDDDLGRSNSFDADEEAPMHEVTVRYSMTTSTNVARADSGQPPVMAIATAKRVSPSLKFVQNHCVLVAVLGLFFVGGIAGLSAYLATRGPDPSPPLPPAPPQEMPPPLPPPPSPALPSNETDMMEDEPLEDELSAEPTSNPTLSSAPSVSSAPSGIPTATPTSAPTMPCNMPSSSRESMIAGIIENVVEDPSVLNDTADPRYWALRWLAKEDGLDPPLCPEADQTRLEQRFVLALLHFAAGGEEEGEGWTYSSSDTQFLDPINECDWTGVDCNSDTLKLTEIELAGRNMRGPLPGEIFALLKDLRVFQLDDNRINGCLPEEVDQASNLEFLYLNANSLSCTLPQSLANLTKLRELEMEGNSISGPVPAGMPSLEKLVLRGNRLNSTLPSEIGPVLSTLHLDNNRLDGFIPEEITDLPLLTSLRLSNNRLNGVLPSALSRLQGLEELYLHNNEISGQIPETIVELSNLRRLTLSQNDINGPLPERFGDLKALEVARFDGNSGITGTLPASIAELRLLEVLSIEETDINGFVSNETCALRVGGNESSGALRRLVASCDDSMSGSPCEGVYSVCCWCCECVLETPLAFVPLERCFPYGEGESLIAPSFQSEGEETTTPPPRSDLIIERILAFDVSEESSVRQPSSPQGMALSWIANTDELNLDPSDSSLLQRYAMAVLYFATEGDSWRKCSAIEGSRCRGSPFLSNISACEWAGISCASRSVIDSIRLDNFGLRGSLPLKELSGLCLSELSLRQNVELSIDFLSENLFFRNLRFLDLSQNAFSGPLVEGVIGPRMLHLNDNRFNGTLPNDIGSTMRLTLNYNEFSGTVPEAWGNSDLRVLRLDNNRLNETVPETLGSLLDLEVLTLHNNDLTGVVPEAVCDLTFDNGGVLEVLWADCGRGSDVRIECDCCSRCFGSSNS